MATRAPPVGLDHPTVVPANLHRHDDGDESEDDDRLDDGRPDDEPRVHTD